MTRRSLAADYPFDHLERRYRRVATRYDKLAANFASAIALAAVVAFWC
jgi:transposase